MKKSREELEKELTKATAKLEQYRHQGQRLANRLGYYQQGERRKRTHRLITRGAAVESIAPDVRGHERKILFCSYGAGLFSAGSRCPGEPCHRPAGG